MSYDLHDIAAALEPVRRRSADSLRQGTLPPKVVVRLQTAEQSALERVGAFNKAFEKVRPRLSAELREIQTKGMKKMEAVKRLRHAAAEFSRVGTRHSACAAGCNHCCHIPVGLFETEARIIGKAIGRPPAAAGANSGAFDAAPFGYEHPCPFLKAGRCSIYEHRPLACRLHLNMDVDGLLCELVENATVPVPLADATVFQGMYAWICQHEKLADIREFFPQQAEAVEPRKAVSSQSAATAPVLASSPIRRAA